MDPMKTRLKLNMIVTMKAAKRRRKRNNSHKTRMKTILNKTLMKDRKRMVNLRRLRKMEQRNNQARRK